jgi:hypothetical protein
MTMKRYIPTLLLTVAVMSLAAAGVLIFAGRVTNATISVREMVQRQMGDPKVIALPFDLQFWGDYKLGMAALQHPDVILVGPSRAAQVRREMFRPYDFYNASLTAWDIDQTIEMLEEVFRFHKPRVAIVDMDYFMFSEPYVKSVKGSRDMWFDAPIRYELGVLPQVLKEWKNNPPYFDRAFSDWSNSRAPHEQERWLGFSELRGTNGFRKDGSYQHGQATFDQSVEKLKINEGILQAIPGAPRLSDVQLQKLSKLASLAKENGVTLIAIQFPMWQDTIKVLDTDENYHYYSGVWREFQSREMLDRFEKLGIAFFDLSHDPLTTEYRNFIDAAHPSERGMLASILSLSKNPKFSTILPELDWHGLEEDLARADVKNDAFTIYGDAH